MDSLLDIAPIMCCCFLYVKSLFCDVVLSFFSSFVHAYQTIKFLTAGSITKTIGSRKKVNKLCTLFQFGLKLFFETVIEKWENVMQLPKDIYVC